MKLDRLISILICLMHHDKMTAPELAARFEVSRRTILRDIDTLAQAGIPIVTEQGSGGGISILSSYKLDKSILTRDELTQLVTGLKGLSSVSDGGQTLLQKLIPSRDSVVSLKESIVIDLSSHYKSSLSEKIGLLKTAIQNNQLITFDYYSDKGETKRVVEPYLIAFKWTAWYLFGWCRERSDFRLFKLNRLWNLRITDEHFPFRAIPDEKLPDNRNFSDDNFMLVRFDKSVRHRLIDDRGLDCYTEMPDGLYMDVPYAGTEYLFSWLLGFGDKAEVLAPKEMRDLFGNQVKNLSRLYF